MIKYDISLNTYTDINNFILTNEVRKIIFADINRVFVAEFGKKVWESNIDLTNWQCISNQNPLKYWLVSYISRYNNNFYFANSINQLIEFDSSNTKKFKILKEF